MKKLKILILAMMVVSMFAGASIVSAQGGTQSGGQPPQGQPPQGQPPQGQPGQGQQQQGQGQPPQGQGGQGGDMSGVVQSVTSASLTVLRANNETFTAIISTTTKIELMATRTTGAVSDIQVGNNVSVEGRKNSDGSIAAMRILVEPSGTKVIGAVSTISGATITVTAQNTKVSVVTTSSTKFLKGQSAGSLADVTTGAMVMAYGTKQSDGSISATYVIVNGAQNGRGQPLQGQVPQGQATPAQTPQRPGQGQPGQGQQPQQGQFGNLAGVVQSVTSSKLTVLRANSETFTAIISTTTKIELAATQAAGTVSDIQVGNNVNIEGRKNTDGTIAAARIMVEPSGAKVAGVVSAISDATISITNQNTKLSIVTTSSTQFIKGKMTGSLSDVVKGAMVTAYGTKQADGSISATYVLINNVPGKQAQNVTSQPNHSARPTPSTGDDSHDDADSDQDQDANLFQRFSHWIRGRFNWR